MILGTVYICSPLRAATPEGYDANIRVAKQYKSWAIRLCYYPIAPHVDLTEILDDTDPIQRAIGQEAGLVILGSCQELWVCGTIISSGMSREITRALELGIRIRYFRIVLEDTASVLQELGPNGEVWQTYRAD